MTRGPLLVGNILLICDGLNGPQLWPAGVIEGVLPGCLELFRKRPILFSRIIAQPETEQMSSPIWGVGEACPAVQQGQIVPEHEVAGL